jgi:hypothetical protein
MQTQPIENIDAVLGRFQAWAGASNASETKPGIRELSYDEALRSRRYRWKAGDEKPAKKKRAAELESSPKPQPGRQKTAPAKLRETKRKPATPARSGNHAAKAALAAKTEAKPAFRDVLAHTVRPPEVILAVEPLELSRQVAISIRLASAERAVIKTRAAEAGISASAYVRQCALEVEQLRAQVQQALAAIERKSMVANAAPTSGHAPVQTSGFLMRLARRFFPRSVPALALRA